MKLKIVTQTKFYWKNEKEKEKTPLMTSQIFFAKFHSNVNFL
jgi:hypothetical protein